MKKIEILLGIVSLISTVAMILFGNELEYIFVSSMIGLSIFYSVFSITLFNGIPLSRALKIKKYKKLTNRYIYETIFIGIGLGLTIFGIMWSLMNWKFSEYFKIGIPLLAVAGIFTVFRLIKTYNNYYFKILLRVVIVGTIGLVVWLIPSDFVNVKDISIVTSDIESISKIIYNFFIPISLIFGAIWTYNVFRERKEAVALKISISEITCLHDMKSNSRYLNIIGIVSNIGDRDLDVIYSESFVYVSRIQKESGNSELIGKIKGLTSENNEHPIGRIRSKVEYNLPYLIEIDKPGVYFIELIIKVRMTAYYSSLIKKEAETIDWSDRKYHQVDF